MTEYEFLKSFPIAILPQDDEFAVCYIAAEKLNFSEAVQRVEEELAKLRAAL